MNIHFEQAIISHEIAQRMMKWYNDPEISSFIHPNFKEEDPHVFTLEDVLKQLEPQAQITHLFIMDDDQVIGEISITKDFHWLMRKSPDSAWISILIGEKSYWGKGIAKMAMRYLEDECRRLGYKRIELGVFDHNHKAQQLYERMGYTPFIINEHITYSDGVWHNDIRMEKDL